MAMNAALEGVKRVLKEEKKEGNSAAAIRNCQALHVGVLELLQAVERHRAGDSCNGGAGESTRELSRLLCHCFSVSAQILTLCKEVESGPSWLFEDLSTHLSVIFKSTYALIKVSTELLDRLSLNQETFETVVASLRSLSASVLDFDPSLPVLVWRGVGKVVCRGRSVVGDGWTVRPIISDVCIAMETKAVECVISAPQEAETSSGGGGGGYVKLLKLCRFLSSLLVKLVQEFQEDYLEFASDIAGLLIHLYGCVPPSPHCSPVNSRTQSEIDSNILLVCEPIFSSLLGSPEFFKSLLSSPDTCERDGGHYGRLMSLCLVLKFFPKLSGGMQDFLIESTSSRESRFQSCRLLDALFSTIQHCSVELQLPVMVAGVMCNGQPQSEVSLYHHLLTNLCCLVACLPQHHFQRLEEVMFRHALSSEEDSFSSLLALDTLSFIARTEERIAERYANLSAQLLLQTSPLLSGHAHRVSCALLRRTLPLLSPHHLSLFLETHSLSSSSSSSLLALWAHLNLTTIANSSHKQVVQSVWDSSREILIHQLQSQQPHLPAVHWSLSCLSSAHPHLPSPQPLPLTLLTRLWDSATQQDLSLKWGTVVLCDCISTTADHICSLPPHILQKIFTSLREMITRGIPTAVCVTVAEFLGRCGCLTLPRNVQGTVLGGLMSVFRLLLGHPCWLVTQHSLVAFQTFAESTRYASVTEECVPAGMNQAVVGFLQRAPYFTWGRADLRDAVFWVEELGRRVGRERRWREGERSDGDTPLSYPHSMVRSKVRLLLETWNELCTLSLPPEVCTQLHKLSTSIQSHLSQSCQFSSAQHQK